MPDFLSIFPLSFTNWVLIGTCAILIGMSKTGVPGVSMIVVPVMAMIFGGKASTGVLLPILITADLFAVIYYHRHAEWKPLLKALPWAFVGLILALWIGDKVNDHQFKNIIAASVLFSLVLMVWNDRKSKKNDLPAYPWFAAVFGILGGFATMIGNVAGPVFAIYLLALKLPKKNYIGTTAWFFAIVNLSKLPLQYFVWENIHKETVLIDLIAVPFVMIGAFAGIKIVHAIKDQTYRWAVVVITFVSALLILL
ncbi:MAG TPA: sulfite exporter TauE/SafE family protein [Prolixibacteraceae bacterium]|nr:sulfite exporter TauE/SafE family protein [Prolixibacteraceae bacterium]